MRVTEVLSIIKNPVYEALPESVLKEKAEWGKGFHKVCYKWLLSGIGVEESSEYWKPLEGFKEWVELAVENVLLAETKFENKELDLNGTPDIIVILKGDTVSTVVDIKTSTAIYYHHRVQLAAYSKLSGSQRRIIWQLKDKKDSKYKIKEFPIEDLDYDWNMFLSAREWYIKTKGSK